MKPIYIVVPVGWKGDVKSMSMFIERNEAIKEGEHIAAAAGTDHLLLEPTNAFIPKTKVEFKQFVPNGD